MRRGLVSMNILTADIDLTFIFLSITIVAGIFVIYKSIRHYQLIRSQEYLLLAYYFFTLTFFALIRIVFAYFSYADIWYYAQDDRYWNFWNFIWLFEILLNTAWAIGIIALLIHVYRLIDWKNRHTVLKTTLILFFIEGVLQAIYYSLFIISMHISQDWATASYTTGSDVWFLRLWVFQFFFQSVNGGTQFYMVLLYLLLGLAYLTLKPLNETRNIRLSRYLWIFFSVGLALKWFAFLSFENDFQFLASLFPFFTDVRTIYFDLNLHELLETISTLALMIIIALFPETLLITEYQLIQGVHLYRFMDSKGESYKRRFQLLDTEKSLAEYVQSIPPELIQKGS